MSTLGSRVQASAARTGGVWCSRVGGAGDPLQQEIDVSAVNRAETTRYTALIVPRTLRDRNLPNPEAAGVKDQMCKCINNVTLLRDPTKKNGKRAESSKRGIAPAQGGRQRRLRLVKRVLPALRLSAELRFGRPHRIELLGPRGW